MKPIIGVTGLIDTKKQSYWMLPDYIHMIEDHGGIPLVLSFSDDPEDVRQELDHIDGLLLTGGQDIQPSLYHELQLEYCGETSLIRDACEYELIKQALARDLPIFGPVVVFRSLTFTLAAHSIKDLMNSIILMFIII